MSTLTKSEIIAKLIERAADRGEILNPDIAAVRADEVIVLRDSIELARQWSPALGPDGRKHEWIDYKSAHRCRTQATLNNLKHPGPEATDEQIKNYEQTRKDILREIEIDSTGRKVVYVCKCLWTGERFLRGSSDLHTSRGRGPRQIQRERRGRNKESRELLGALPQHEKEEILMVKKDELDLLV